MASCARHADPQERLPLGDDMAVPVERGARLAEVPRLPRALRVLGKAHEVAATVTVSSTGIVTPSLDSLLQAPLGLSPTVQRVPVFGLGCAGGVIGAPR